MSLTRQTYKLVFIPPNIFAIIFHLLCGLGIALPLIAIPNSSKLQLINFAPVILLTTEDTEIFKTSK